MILTKISSEVWAFCDLKGARWMHVCILRLMSNCGCGNKFMSFDKISLCFDMVSYLLEYVKIFPVFYSSIFLPYVFMLLYTDFSLEVSCGSLQISMSTTSPAKEPPCMGSVWPWEEEEQKAKNLTLSVPKFDALANIIVSCYFRAWGYL